MRDEIREFRIKNVEFGIQHELVRSFFCTEIEVY